MDLNYIHKYKQYLLNIGDTVSQTEGQYNFLHDLLKCRCEMGDKESCLHQLLPFDKNSISVIMLYSFMNSDLLSLKTTGRYGILSPILTKKNNIYSFSITDTPIMYANLQSDYIKIETVHGDCIGKISMCDKIHSLSGYKLKIHRSKEIYKIRLYDGINCYKYNGLLNDIEIKSKSNTVFFMSEEIRFRTISPLVAFVIAVLVSEIVL